MPPGKEGICSTTSYTLLLLTGCGMFKGSLFTGSGAFCPFCVVLLGLDEACDGEECPSLLLPFVGFPSDLVSLLSATFPSGVSPASSCEAAMLSASCVGCSVAAVCGSLSVLEFVTYSPTTSAISNAATAHTTLFRVNQLSVWSSSSSSMSAEWSDAYLWFDCLASIGSPCNLWLNFLSSNIVDSDLAFSDY